MIALLPAAGACEKMSTRWYRSEVIDTGNSNNPSEEDDPGDKAVYDTTLYVAAVIVPSYYDWRRDTAYGATPCNLVLYKNGIPVVDIVTGSSRQVGNSPDTHHIIGGHIYTEYCTVDETVIRRDGELLFSYKGREILRGLMDVYGDVYTLGKSRSDDSFTFRCNGELVLRQNGTIFGSFSDSAYGRTGALYEDSGQICFCYKGSSSAFAVRNGTPEAVSSGRSLSRVCDMRCFGGNVWTVSKYGTMVSVSSPTRNYALPSSASWLNVRLFPHDGTLWFLGDTESGNTIAGSLGSLSDTAPVLYTFVGNNNYLYHDGDAVISVGLDDMDIMVQDASGHLLLSVGDCFFFGRDCAVNAGGTLCVALSPHDTGQPPFVWMDGRRECYDIYGYISGVDLEITRSR